MLSAVAEEMELEDLDKLRLAIDARDASALLAVATEIHYADLAHAYENFDDEDRDFLLQTIGPELATDLIGELPWTLIEDALSHFKPAQLRIILGNLSDDDRVDIFQIVSPENQRRFFSLLGPADEQLTRNLLKYEEDTAGGRMTTAIGRITADMTVKQAITVLRRHQDSAETLSRIFVVDEEGRLVGKVRLRDLAFHPWATPIHDIMEDADERVLATIDQEAAARMLSSVRGTRAGRASPSPSSSPSSPTSRPPTWTRRCTPPRPCASARRAAQTRPAPPHTSVPLSPSSPPPSSTSSTSPSSAATRAGT
jgi:magnesium transporter